MSEVVRKLKKLSYNLASRFEAFGIWKNMIFPLQLFLDKTAPVVNEALVLQLE